MLTVTMLAMLATQERVASTQSMFHDHIVILCPPVLDDAVFEKTTQDFSKPADVRAAFPESDYLIVEKDPAWTFVYSRQLPSLRQQLNKVSVLEAFLKHADSRGIVRFGDLTKDEQAAALAFLVGPGSDIDDMGRAAQEIHVALRPVLCMSGSNGDKSVEHRLSGQSPDNNKEIMADLTAHGVPFLPRSSEQQAKLTKELLKTAKDLYGINVRYYGIPQSQWLGASLEAMDELDRQLQDKEKQLGPTYDGLQSKLAGFVRDAFGGTIPKDPMAPTQAPSKFLRSLVGAMRAFPAQFGIEDQAASERFLSKLSSVQFDVAYEIEFVRMAGQDENGNPVQAAGFSVQIGRG